MYGNSIDLDAGAGFGLASVSWTPLFASSQGIQFSVVVTEGRPDETGLAMARELHELGVPVIAILDSAVAFALERLRCAWLLRKRHQ